MAELTAGGGAQATDNGSNCTVPTAVGSQPVAAPVAGPRAARKPACGRSCSPRGQACPASPKSAVTVPTAVTLLTAGEPSVVQTVRTCSSGTHLAETTWATGAASGHQAEEGDGSDAGSSISGGSLEDDCDNDEGQPVAAPLATEIHKAVSPTARAAATAPRPPPAAMHVPFADTGRVNRRSLPEVTSDVAARLGLSARGVGRPAVRRWPARRRARFFFVGGRDLSAGVRFGGRPVRRGASRCGSAGGLSGVAVT